MSGRSRRGEAVPSAPTDQGESARPDAVEADEVTIEYIKENDFGPQRFKKYSPRSINKPKRNIGKGYYVTKESEAFVRRFVEEMSRPGSDKKRVASAQTKKRGLVKADLSATSTMQDSTLTMDDAGEDLQSSPILTKNRLSHDINMAAGPQSTNIAKPRTPKVQSHSLAVSAIVEATLTQAHTPTTSSTTTSAAATHRSQSISPTRKVASGHVKKQEGEKSDAVAVCTAEAGEDVQSLSVLMKNSPSDATNMAAGSQSSNSDKNKDTKEHLLLPETLVVNGATLIQAQVPGTSIPIVTATTCLAQSTPPVPAGLISPKQVMSVSPEPTQSKSVFSASDKLLSTEQTTSVPVAALKSPEPAKSVPRTPRASACRRQSVSPALVKSMPYGPKSVVADTISSLLNLFGERKKQQLVTPSKTPAGASPDGKPALRRSTGLISRKVTTPSTSAITKNPSSPAITPQKVSVVVTSHRGNTSDVSATKTRIAQGSAKQVTSPQSNTVDLTTPKIRIVQKAATEIMSPKSSITDSSRTKTKSRTVQNDAVDAISPRSNISKSSKTTRISQMGAMEISSSSIRAESNTTITRKQKVAMEVTSPSTTTSDSSITKTRIAHKSALQLTSPNRSTTESTTSPNKTRVPVVENAAVEVPSSRSIKAKSSAAKNKIAQTAVLDVISPSSIATESATAKTRLAQRLTIEDTSPISSTIESLTIKTGLMQKAAMEVNSPISNTDESVSAQARISLVQNSASGESEPLTTSHLAPKRYTKTQIHTVAPAATPIHTEIKETFIEKVANTTELIEDKPVVEPKLPLAIQGTKSKSPTIKQAVTIQRKKPRAAAVRKNTTQEKVPNRQISEPHPQISVSLKEKIVQSLSRRTETVAQPDVPPNDESAKQSDNFPAAICEQNTPKVLSSKEKKITKPKLKKDDIVGDSPITSGCVTRRRARSTDSSMSDTVREDPVEKPNTEIVGRTRKKKSVEIVKTFTLRSSRQKGKISPEPCKGPNATAGEVSIIPTLNADRIESEQSCKLSSPDSESAQGSSVPMMQDCNPSDSSVPIKKKRGRVAKKHLQQVDLDQTVTLLTKSTGDDIEPLHSTPKPGAVSRGRRRGRPARVTRVKVSAEVSDSHQADGQELLTHDNDDNPDGTTSTVTNSETPEVAGIRGVLEVDGTNILQDIKEKNDRYDVTEDKIDPVDTLDRTEVGVSIEHGSNETQLPLRTGVVKRVSVASRRKTGSSYEQEAATSMPVMATPVKYTQTTGKLRRGRVTKKSIPPKDKALTNSEHGNIDVLPAVTSPVRRKKTVLIQHADFPYPLEVEVDDWSGEDDKVPQSVVGREDSQSEIVHDVGTESEIVPDIGNNCEIEPDVGNKSEIVPDVNNESELVPGVGNKGKIVPDVSNESEIVPDIGNMSEIVPDASNRSEIVPDITNQDDDDMGMSVVSIGDGDSEVVPDISMLSNQDDTDDNQSWQDDRSVCSIISDQSSITGSEFSFRTPLPKAQRRSRKRKRGASTTSSESTPKVSRLDDSVPLDDSLLSTTSRRSSRQRVVKLYSECYSTYSASPEPDEKSEEVEENLTQKVTKESCPGCGVVYHPVYLRVHMATKCPNIKPKSAKAKRQAANVKPVNKVPAPMSIASPSLSVGEGYVSGSNAGTCFICGKVYKKKLQYHQRWCGRDKEKVTCEICGNEILLKKFDRHMQFCTTPNETPDVTSGVMTSDNVMPGDGMAGEVTAPKSRQAARKAMSNIKSFIAESDKPPTPKKPRYIVPKGKQITPYFMKKWKCDLAKNREIRCPFSISGCQYVTDTIDQVSTHYQRCQWYPSKKNYKCVCCPTESATLALAKKHSRTHEWSDASDEDSDMEQIADDEDADPDANFSPSNSDSDKDAYSTEMNVMPASTTKVKRLKHRRETKNVDQQPDHKNLTRTHAERLEMFHEAMQWTLDWRQKNEPSGLGAMVNWWPRKEQWLHLKPEEVDQYLPTATTSPWFRLNEKGMPTTQTTLGLFDSVMEPMNMLNVGGPVWSLDWLPTAIGEEHAQYLAVYAHRHHDLHHPVLKAVSGPSTIQIWDMGTMRSSTLNVPPKLSLVLAHNEGAIWCIKWCPRRLWPRDVPRDGRLPWLGTLAVATSSGKISIYSIPVPDSMPQSGADYNLPVYKAKPVLMLKLHARDVGVLMSCRCLDWQVLDGCSRLVAGYAGGHMAVYDLLTSSPLLTTRSNIEGWPDTLHPLLSFNAHGCPVTSIAFCQRRPNFFTSVSQDRTMKVWNFENLDYPVNAISKSEYTKVIWPLHWAAIFAATDNCFCLEHNALFMIDTGYFGIQNRPLTVHNGCIMDVSFSEWLNTCISVDSAGIVETMYLPYLMLTHKHHKSFSSRRRVMFSTTYEPLTKCQCGSAGTPIAIPCDPSTPLSHTVPHSQCLRCGKPQPTTQDTLSKPLPGSTSCSADEEDGTCSPTLLASVHKVMRTMEEDVTPPPPLNVTDMKRNYAVAYEDKMLNALNTCKETRIRSAKDLRADVLMPPLAAQYKVEWNPNLGSHLWAAVGGEAGLVRIVFLSAFGSAKERQFVKDVFDKKKKAAREIMAE